MNQPAVVEASTSSEPVADALAAAPAKSILVVGTDQWAIDQAASQLGAAGRVVMRCHEPGDAAFPCNALIPGRRCPLDMGVDVVLDVRARPVSPPPLDEFGAVCALHAGVPLVVAGVAGDGGFGPWAVETAHGNQLVSACDAGLMARRTQNR